MSVEARNQPAKQEPDKQERGTRTNVGGLTFLAQPREGTGTRNLTAIEPVCAVPRRWAVGAGA